jgi:hypothetical protein
MKKDKHFRSVVATCLCGLLVILVWWRAEWTAVQIGCFVVVLLVGGALLVNNQRSEAFRHAAFLPLAAAGVVYIWTDTRDRTQGVINFLISLLLVWISLKPYYLKWMNSHSHADGSVEPPVGLEEKSNS